MYTTLAEIVVYFSSIRNDLFIIETNSDNWKLNDSTIILIIFKIQFKEDFVFVNNLVDENNWRAGFYSQFISFLEIKKKYM